MVFEGQVAAPAFQTNLLTKGLSPFTCGFYLSNENLVIQERMSLYDHVMQNGTQPTLADNAAFATTEVPIPVMPYQLTAMLEATSVILDVIQGQNHQHAIAFRRFVTQDARLIARNCSFSGTGAEILPRVARSVQLKMASYFRKIMDSLDPRPPDYSTILEAIEQGLEATLPTIPSEYTAPSRAQQDNTIRNQLGSQCTNPAQVQPWIQQWRAAGLRLNAVREHAPTITNNGVQQELCLKWHLLGQCYENCERRDSHRTLTAAERRKVETFLRQHAPAQASTTANAAPAAPTPP